MKRRNEYVAFPGHCMVTRSSDTSHGVLDLEFDREYDGASYLCGKLVEEAAALWGWVSPEKYQAIIEQRDAARREVNELQARLDAYVDLDRAKAVVAEIESVPA
jgi:hypothetical protein